MARTIRRRRKEAKTDYKARFALLKSGKLRLVVRKTNRYIIVQVVESNIAQDKTLMRVSSKDLLEKSWPKEKEGSLKSLAAAYLTGFLLAKQYGDKIKEIVLDTGLHRTVHGSRIFAVVKGALDGGLTIAHNPKALPNIERIKTSNKSSVDLEKIKEKL